MNYNKNPALEESTEQINGACKTLICLKALNYLDNTLEIATKTTLIE